MQLVKEHELQGHAEPEHRNSGADHREQANRAVDRSAGPARRKHGEKEADRQIENEADEQQFERGRKILREAVVV